MKEHTSVLNFKSLRQSVITVGTFDGVHIGHKTILQHLVQTAKDENLDSVVLTFFPHPRMVLQKDTNIQLINTIDERKKLLKETGIDHLVIEPFTKEFSRLTALEYVQDILVHGLGVKKIIIGYDHRFGRNRTANIEDLKTYGKTYGFEVEEIGVKQLDNIAISSTKIRNAVTIGDIETVNAYLGYLFMLSGTVIKGKAIGRTLGYPTANIQLEESYKLIPTNGVYVVQATISGKNYYGITSIGTNPTVGGTQKTIETFFLDFDENLYNKSLRIEFLTHIRDEETFNSLIELKEAIAKDEIFAREFLKNRE